MTKRATPPGHTKPSSQGVQVPPVVLPLLRRLNVLRFPRAAKVVLGLAAFATFVLVLLDGTGRSGVVVVALVMVGAFGEAMRPWRDEMDAEMGGDGPPAIYERAFANVIWVGLAMALAALLGGWARALTGLGEGSPL